MRNMRTAMEIPPRIKLGRRPQLSAQMVAGIVTAKMTRPDTPDARKLASFDDKPACLKTRGAY
jgi:hypothetical protein